MSAARTRTLQRLERILAMVPWLLDNPGVPVEEVVDRFGVTRAELAADLDVLGYCGLPGYGGGDLVEAAIVGDLVTVRMADFFRRPLRLSLREAVTLVLAARAMAGVEGLPEGRALASAEAKLAAAMGDPAAPAAPRVAVDLRAPGDEHLPALRRALAEHRVVRLRYRSGSKAQTSERDVEPWALTGAGGAWYLQGFCRLVHGPRDFRLDRIRELTLTDEVAPIPTTVPEPPAYRPRPGHVDVVLDLAAEAWWVAEEAVVDRVEERGERRRIRLRVPELEWVARLVLGLGPAVEVVQPPALRERVAALARTALRRYADLSETSGVETS